MKPFDLEKALAGEPVVTRDGSKVTEIHYFKTASDNRCIVAIIDSNPIFLSKDGCYDNPSLWHPTDLLMASVHKSGWINIYPNNVCGDEIWKNESLAERWKYLNGIERIACIKVEWEE